MNPKFQLFMFLGLSVLATLPLQAFSQHKHTRDVENDFDDFSSRDFDTEDVVNARDSSLSSTFLDARAPTPEPFIFGLIAGAIAKARAKKAAKKEEEAKLRAEGKLPPKEEKKKGKKKRSLDTENNLEAREDEDLLEARAIDLLQEEAGILARELSYFADAWIDVSERGIAEDHLEDIFERALEELD